MTVATPHTAGHVVLRNVLWKTYEAILEDPGSRHVRLTYDRGALEIMSPSRKHERARHILRRLLETLAFEWQVVIQGAGATTCKDELKEKGLEPDESYYVQHEPAMRVKQDFDPTTDPWPDLAIEIEISRSVLDRLAIYASLGIPEIWRCDGTRVGAWLLQPDGTYQESETSRAFPFLRMRDLERFLRRAQETDEHTCLREFIAWVREQRAGRP